ncbi:hypothetical protein VCHA53O466_40021 [Vibrio chagasii]|nr:hypothetical protein VCHA53O466_40021 [Vibrio chagasii]
MVSVLSKEVKVIKDYANGLLSFYLGVSVEPELILELVHDEFSAEFEILVTDDSFQTEMGYFSVCLPIAKSWWTPSLELPKRKRQSFLEDTPAWVKEIAIKHLDGGHVGLAERKGEAVFYLPDEVEIDIEVKVADSTFEYPAEYEEFVVVTSREPQSMLDHIIDSSYPKVESMLAEAGFSNVDEILEAPIYRTY